MTEKIEHQDLEFPCPDSQVLEIKKSWRRSEECGIH